MNKVIVLGGAGFIGTNVCLSALGRGMEVVVLDNLSRPGTAMNMDILREHGQVSLVQADIRDAEKITQFFADHADANAIFHLAGQVAVTTSIKNPQEDFDINLRGTFNILEGMRLANVQAPLIYASTNKVYGDLKSLNIVDAGSHYAYADYPHGISEEFPLEFHSPYGCSKGSADQYVLDYSRIYDLKTIVFRQSCIYGYYQFGIEDQGWVAWFTIASLFDKQINIFGDGKQVRDVLFIDDLVNAYWMAIDNIAVTNGQAYNIGGADFRLSLLELIAYLEKYLGKSIPLDFGSARQGDQRVFVSDIRKATQEFGWRPHVSVEAGVKALADWAVDNKDLFIRAGIIKASSLQQGEK